MPEHDPLQSLWKSQKQEDFSMTLADIHARAERFQRRVRMRNWIEYAAAALVIAGFTWAAFAVADVIVQAACVLIVLASLYVAWKLASVARASAKTDETMSWADFHRAELARQRDALNSIWRWYLGPFVPGWVVFWIGVGLPPPTNALWGNAGVAALGFAFGIAVFFAIATLNKWAAKKLQAEIDALDRMRSG